MNFRILDANFNRAREALRVLEDIARFQFDDRRLARATKELRHRLSAAFRPFSRQLVASRDASGDVLRADPHVQPHPGTHHAVRANFLRVQEAMRSLEESSRILEHPRARQFSSMRFASYDLEKRFHPWTERFHRLDNARLYVLIDTEVARRPVHELGRALSKAGADILQLRTVGRTDERVAKRLVRTVRTHSDALVIINDDVRTAAGVDADGVHLGLDDEPVTRAREVLGAARVIGATTHSGAEARAASRAGADYLSYGPVYRTAIKPALAPRGFRYVSVMMKIGLPFFAIGGITRKKVAELRKNGVDRVAVCSEILRDADPARATRLLKRAL